MIICKECLQKLGVKIPDGFKWNHTKCSICVSVWGRHQQRETINLENPNVAEPTKDNIDKVWRQRFKAHPRPKARAEALEALKKKEELDGKKEADNQEPD